MLARIFTHGLAAYLFWEDDAKMKTMALTEVAFATVNAIMIPFVKGSDVW